MNTKSVVIYSSFALLLAFFIFLSIYNPDTFLPYYITRPSFLVLMMIMYISITQKPNKLFLLFQFCTALAEFLQYKIGGLPFVSILLYTLGALLLIKVVYSFITSIKKKDFITFFLFYILIFVVIFFGVLDEDSNKIKIIIYGLTFVILATLIFVNFLRKMTLPNLLLFIAIIIETISNEMAVMDESYALTDKPILIATTLTTLLTHYLFCLGFIYKDHEATPRNGIE